MIPDRILPAVIVGAGVASCGVFGGLATGTLIAAPTKAKIVQLLALPLIVLPMLLIRSAWKRPPESPKMVEVSPRLFSIICSVCLVVEFATGIILGTQLIEP
jgi:hypothetical protein